MVEVHRRHQTTLLYPSTQTFSLQSVFINLTSGHGLDKQQWNALVGIVTAIIGNVLISFALNIQRYAHIRLNREEKKWQSSAKLGLDNREQCATQIEDANRTSEFNAKVSGVGDMFGKEPDEQTSLMNRNHTRKSNYSENTAQPPSPDTDDDSDVDDDDDDDDDHQKSSYLKSPWWWAGIILMTVGEAGNFLAYGFAPASLVSPLGVVALISNCIIAPWLLKEKFRKRDALGVLIAVGGVVTLVLSSEGHEKRMGPEDIWSEITRWEFELYLGITTGVILGLVWASAKYGDRTLLIDLGLVGLFGGYTALATKGIASMLSDTLWKAITFPITYLLLAILIATALMQIRYLNRALSRFDSTQVIPTQFVIFTISVIVGSAILYRDFESADAQRFCKFIGGCALTFLGVYLITSGRESNDGTRKEDENDKEQGIDLINEEEISENEIAEDGRFTTPSRSTRTSQRPPSRTSLVERMISNVSQQSQPYTPSSLGPDSPFGQNLWTESPRDDNFRRHSNYASSSVVIDTSTNNTPVRPSFLTPTSGRHSRQRGSMVDIFPGLISTTLSSSLSGIMVDRRRDFEASSSKARRGLGPGRSKSSRLRNTESGGSWNGLQRTLPSAPVLTFEALTTNDPVEVVGTDDSSKRFLFRSLSIGDPSGSSSTAGQRLESKADANTGADTSGDQRCFTSTS